MAFPVASRKHDFVSCPRAHEVDGAEGQVVAITVSATPDFIDLRKGVSQAAFNRTKGDDQKSVTRNYLTIECDVDLGIIFGRTSDLVTSGNVPVIATVGTNTTGTYAGAAGTCHVLYAKQPARFLLQDGIDNFLGFVGAGAGTVRMYQSSADNA